MQSDEILYLKKRINHHVEKALPEVLGALGSLSGDPAEAEGPLEVEAGKVLSVGDDAEQMLLRPKNRRLDARRFVGIAHQAAPIRRRGDEGGLVGAPANRGASQTGG